MSFLFLSGLSCFFLNLDQLQTVYPWTFDVGRYLCELPPCNQHYFFWTSFILFSKVTLLFCVNSMCRFTDCTSRIRTTPPPTVHTHVCAHTYTHTCQSFCNSLWGTFKFHLQHYHFIFCFHSLLPFFVSDLISVPYHIIFPGDGTPILCCLLWITAVGWLITSRFWCLSVIYTVICGLKSRVCTLLNYHQYTLVTDIWLLIYF